MGLIRIRRGETVAVTRVTRDGSADSPEAMPDVEKTAFGKPSSITLDDAQRGRRTVIERNWFCARAADVATGDRITRANGEQYSVIAGPFGDNDHPLTGHDFGIKRYRVRGVSAPRG